MYSIIISIQVKFRLSFFKD